MPNEQGNKTNFSDWNKNLTQLKKNPNFDWLKKVSSVPLQQSLRHLDKAFKAFFNKKARNSHSNLRSNLVWDG